MDFDRKLASIRVVNTIVDIPKADFVQIAVVDGWNCVVKKGEFAPGDMGVFFEIDSFLPGDDARYSFLAKDFRNFNGNVGARLKTRNFRGQLSQGLMMPLSAFPEITSPSVGDDVTGLLRIVKWVSAEDDDGVPGVASASRFPSFIQKTNQCRIQNIPFVLNTERDSLWEVSVKLDGSSLTVFYGGPENMVEKPTMMMRLRNTIANVLPFIAGVPVPRLGVCSRNMELSKPRWFGRKKSPMWDIVRHYKLDRALTYLGDVLGTYYAIQGEMVGPRINGNRDKLSKLDFYVFDVYDIKNKRYLLPADRMMVIDRINQYLSTHGITDTVKMVPVVETISLARFADLNEVLAYADGPSLNPGVNREGVVFKKSSGGYPITGCQSFKVISNRYLLEKD